MLNVVEPIEGVELIDLALYLKEDHVLIITDLHIGYEEALTKQGVLVPKFHFKDLVRRLERIFSFLEGSGREVEVCVINGDLKHEFGTISDEGWRNTLKCLDFLSEKAGKIVLVKGNHDKILGPIAEKRDVCLVDEFLVGDVLICHGHRIPGGAGGDSLPPSVKTLIIGHDHPAVSLKEGSRVETFKSFIVGTFKNKDLIVQPSFNQLVEGTDVKSERLLSPFLHQDIGDFDVYVVADTVYNFGKLKNLP